MTTSITSINISSTVTITDAYGDEVEVEVGDWLEVASSEGYDRGQVMDVGPNEVEVAWIGAADKLTHTPSELARCHVYGSKPADDCWAREWPMYDDEGEITE